jgi:ABC-2 type transport system ATP-binding protein
MKMITGYIQPTEGSIRVMDVDVTENPIHAQSMIGYLPEHNPLYLDMYVHEYLNFSANTYGLRGKRKQTAVEQTIAQVGLEPEQNKRLKQLSKGYRQRVGLAQALTHDPDVLILDEPTTGLDPNQILEIREVIRKVAVTKTIIFSSHIMQEVQALCDHIVILNKGKMVANDTIANVQQGLQTDKIISITYSRKPDPAYFTGIEGVHSIREEIDNKLVFNCHSNADPRETIFARAAELNLPIISMNVEEGTMEDIFKSLTA